MLYYGQGMGRLVGRGVGNSVYETLIFQGFSTVNPPDEPPASYQLSTSHIYYPNNHFMISKLNPGFRDPLGAGPKHDFFWALLKF